MKSKRDDLWTFSCNHRHRKDYRIWVACLSVCLLLFFAWVNISIADSTSLTEEITKLNTQDKDFMKGYSNASEGKHREAIADFSRVIYRDQYDFAAHYRRGLSYLAVNESDLALQDIEYAMGGIQVDTRRALPYKSMKSIAGKVNDPQKIIPIMDKAIKENPEDADAFYNRGTAYLAMGKFDTAINDFSQAINLKPQDLDYHYNRKVALNRSVASQRLLPSSATGRGSRNYLTKVKIIGNSVFVPVTLVNDGNEVGVYLLLDTGATRTAINTEIADQLSINSSRARRANMQVVGGNILEVSVVRISSVSVGPHTKHNWEIVVVPHKSSVARYDGLLGMDILRGLKYEVDFEKQVIVWR
ncbi:MAG: Tetratricopeptide repeat protein [Syntrophus sp. PtaB.Bin001]|nr:MAG: Tetratricopeptide repeat protein [Syntrophus sp. PtaB.Bin001]